MPKFLEILGKLAPTVATLLGGPLAGMAAETVGDALGLPGAAPADLQKVIESGRMTAEQVAALRQAELDLQLKLKQLDIDVEKLASDDRANARAMQVSTRSWVPAALAVTLTVGFFGILIGLMTGDLKLWDNSGLQMLLGSLGTSWGMVVSFYFGSSASSRAKDEALTDLKKG